MVTTRTAGTRAFLVGLVATAIASGSAAGARPIVAISVQARLAPVSGTSAAGNFSGTLVRNVSEQPVQTPPLPRNGSRWRPSWKVVLPPLGGPAAVTLRIGAAGGAAADVRVLCARCTNSAKGAMALTNSEATRVMRGDAVVLVRASSATLRGVVRVRRSAGLPLG